MADPKVLHVTQLVPGTVLRISMKPGRQLEIDHTHQMASPRKSRMARGSDRTVINGFLLTNDPVNGKFTVNVESKPIAVATIRYGDVAFMQRWIDTGRKVFDHAPPEHPGASALGTTYATLFTQPYLVRVAF